jgi:hypothetical protein
MRIVFPGGLRMAVAHEMFPNRTIAVFVNGALMCPDQPGDPGDYCLGSSGIEFHSSDIGPGVLVTIMDFRSFRWTCQDGRWNNVR